mmetsp:Transcript_11957/g.35947  ORF Transcript_11957/g.35947 Transcript_11957/m.35947 type:complete len:351 (+) Transcript_11957:1897-2949(+)
MRNGTLRHGRLLRRRSLRHRQRSQPLRLLSGLGPVHRRREELALRPLRQPLLQRHGRLPLSVQRRSECGQLLRRLPQRRLHGRRRRRLGLPHRGRRRRRARRSAVPARRSVLAAAAESGIVERHARMRPRDRARGVVGGSRGPARTRRGPHENEGALRGASGSRFPTLLRDPRPRRPPRSRRRRRSPRQSHHPPRRHARHQRSHRPARRRRHGLGCGRPFLRANEESCSCCGSIVLSAASSSLHFSTASRRSLRDNKSSLLPSPKLVAEKTRTGCCSGAWLGAQRPASAEWLPFERASVVVVVDRSSRTRSRYRPRRRRAGRACRGGPWCSGVGCSRARSFRRWAWPCRW